LTLEGRPRTLRSAPPIATRQAPHTASAERRHSYVTHLIEFGYPERFVTDQVGHRWGSTTAIYTSVSDDFKNKTLRAALARVYQPEPHTHDEDGSRS